ncbi:MAG TPA: hypothetical protein ENF17_05050 [Candidatus Aminicenantes bacterium]|nr:hypothetical protein [Candidatus Aminicenantes bacterium]
MEPEKKRIDPYVTWVANYCKHCFICINICPVDNLFFGDDEMASQQKCIQCLLCMKYCPDFALEVKSKKETSLAKRSSPDQEDSGVALPSGKKGGRLQP